MNDDDLAYKLAGVHFLEGAEDILAAELSPREMLVRALADLDAGKVKPVMALLIMREAPTPPSIRRREHLCIARAGLLETYQMLGQALSKVIDVAKMQRALER